MKILRYSLVATVAVFSAYGGLLSCGTAVGQTPEEGEVLTRGPLHEAFAAAVNLDPEPGILINVAPPEPIEELPPDLQPEGENVTWIAGYWAWDGETEDFLWVSGIWRNIPPGREWIPGYWNQVGTQFQWVSGYWADLEEEETTYLPRPPESVESGPNVDPPSVDHSWIPGVWVWRESRYFWRPGYWELLRDDWTYVPDCYRWTPRGYIHVYGYWDYPVVRRGVVFAPVRFHRSVYGRPGYFYSPRTVISLSLLVNHLFVRPSYCHYYYGDYYEPRYRESGFYASFSYHSGHRGYDPIYAHRRWEHRREGDWDRRSRDNYEYFRDHQDARPPRSWDRLRELPDGRRGAKGRDGDYVVASPIQHFEKERDGGERFRKVDAPARERYVKQSKEMGAFSKERRTRESVREKVEGSDAKTSSLRGSRSPVKGQKMAELPKEKAPPKRSVSVARGGTKPETSARSPREESPGRGRPSSPKEEPKGSDRKPGSQVVPRPGPKPGDKPEKPETKQPERKPSSQVVPRPGPKRGDKPEPGRAEPSRESKPMPKAEPKRESRPEPKRVEPSRAEPKRESRPEPKRVEPKRESKPEPKRVEPKRESRPEPKRVEPSRVEPKRESRPEPKHVEPKRESKPEPKKKEKEEKDSKKK